MQFLGKWIGPMSLLHVSSIDCPAHKDDPPMVCSCIQGYFTRTAIRRCNTIQYSTVAQIEIKKKTGDHNDRHDECIEAL